MGRFENTTALVTGGASGVGKAIATRLAADGASVVITDIDPDVGSLTATQCGFVFLEHDVTDEARWHEVVREVERDGHVDVLVNNAGVSGPLQDQTPEATSLTEWKRVFAANVEGVFLGCQAALPAIRRAGGGSIVNISSIAALVATPEAVAYGASKAAVEQLTRSVAQYCAERKLNIRCNSVHPGNVRTVGMYERYAEAQAQTAQRRLEDVLAEGRAEVPLGDLTLPEDVAASVSFLASQDARHITATKVVVDGGFVGCDTFRWRSDGGVPVSLSREASET